MAQNSIKHFKTQASTNVSKVTCKCRKLQKCQRIESKPLSIASMGGEIGATLTYSNKVYADDSYFVHTSRFC